MVDLRSLLPMLHLRNKDPKDMRLLALNSICNSLIEHMAKYLDQKLNKEQRKGLIFLCDKGLFTRYDRDFREILDDLGYRSIAQNIPESEKINEFLKLRLKEHLAKETEQSGNRRLKGSAGVKDFLAVEGEITNNTKAVYERSETLIGLIESYLYSRNLMLIIIINGNDLNLSDFRPTINDVFAAGINSDYKAALTMIYTSPFNSNDILPDENWFKFIPQELVKDEQFVDFIWSRLKPEQQVLIGNSSILKEYLSKSKGSRGILREIWNKRWEK
jgi:hypothetical protein